MLLAGAPAHVRALVQDLVRQTRPTAAPYEDVKVFVCLAAAARAVGVETNVEHELEGALGRALKARLWSAAHVELRAAILHALDVVSFEHAAPFRALQRLADALLLARGADVRFRVVQGLAGVGALDAARDAAQRLRGFERRRALRVVERGVVRGTERARDRFIALVAPPVLCRLVPTADSVAALGRRATRAFEPWIGAEADRICAALDGRARERAMAHASVVAYFVGGRGVATRSAEAISSRAHRENALVLLVEAALRANDTAFALELVARLGGTRRRIAESFLDTNWRPGVPSAARWSLTDAQVFTGMPNLLADWLRFIFDELRVARHHPLFALGAAGAADRPPEGRATDPLSIERALFDDGVASSPRAVSRRAVLVRAAKHVLKRAVDCDAVDARVTAARLRTLERLGGARSCEAIEAVIAPVSAYRTVVGDAISTLAAVDRERGVRAFARAQRIVTARSDLERLSVSLEHVEALERGFSRAWLRLRDRLAAGRGDVWAADWLARAAEYCVGRGLPLSIAVTNVFHDAFEDVVAPAPERIAGRALVELDALAVIPRERHLARLVGDPRLVETLRAFRPARPGPSAPAWDRERTMQAIGALWPDPDASIDSTLVEKFVRTSTRRYVEDRTRSLLAGRCPIEGGHAIELEGGLRLRWLDKRADVLEHLRFADVVPCCLSSDELDSRYVLLAWWDPLSFVCLIEKRDASRSVGFVLGGFAWKGSTADPAMVLNGVYLTRQDGRVRARIVDAIENRIARPLGMIALGLAAEHGGRGPLPARYVQEPARIERLRALRNARGLTSEIFDDVGGFANVPISVDHLYWCQIRSEPVRLLRRLDRAS